MRRVAGLDEVFTTRAFGASSPGRHVPLHVDIHAVEQTFHRVCRGQKQVSDAVADGAHEKDLAQRLPDASRRNGQRSRVFDEGFLTFQEAFGVDQRRRGGGVSGGGGGAGSAHPFATRAEASLKRALIEVSLL